MISPKFYYDPLVYTHTYVIRSAAVAAVATFLSAIYIMENVICQISLILGIFICPLWGIIFVN